MSSIAWDGFNTIEHKINHRIEYSKCGKQFGKDIEMIELLVYQEKIKKILYELFFYKYPLVGIATRWDVPQDKLSKFKKSFVLHVFQQNSEIIEQKIKALPRGVILGDETYMGSRVNFNAEIVFINNDYEILSTGPVDGGELKESILKVFNKIPEACKKNLKFSSPMVSLLIKQLLKN